MPLLKAQPKQPKSATIQVRVEEDIKLRLDKYAEFIDSSPAYVVTGALKLLFNKDREFKSWLGEHTHNSENQSQSDIDWDRSTISIARSWVAGNVEGTKTEGSTRPLPMDRALASVLRQHKEKTKRVDSEWIFANPETGSPYWPDKIRENHLIPTGIAAGIGRVGWHTFRHTYSCLLREHEVDVKVQQSLMRHADIRTAMNIYTQAIPKAVREANRRVVRSIMGKKAALRRQ